MSNLSNSNPLVKGNPIKKGYSSQFDLEKVVDLRKLVFSVVSFETIPLKSPKRCYVAIGGSLGQNSDPNHNENFILILDIDSRKVVRKIELNGLTNQIFYHPFFKLILFEDESRLYETKLLEKDKRLVTNDFSNTASASSCSTRIIGMLTKEIIVFPRSDQKTLVVFNLSTRKTCCMSTVEYNDIRSIKANPLGNDDEEEIERIFFVGGYRCFYVLSYDIRKSICRTISMAQGSRYGFVYDIEVVNNRYLVTGSNSGECNVYVNYLQGTSRVQKLFHSQDFNNGSTTSFAFGNFLIVASRDQVNCRILEFSPHNEEDSTSGFEKENWGVYTLDIKDENGGEIYRKYYETLNEGKGDSVMLSSVQTGKFIGWDGPGKERLVSGTKKGIFFVWKNRYSFRGQNEGMEEDERERLLYLFDFEGEEHRFSYKDGIENMIFRVKIFEKELVALKSFFIETFVVKPRGKKE